MVVLKQKSRITQPFRPVKKPSKEALLEITEPRPMGGDTHEGGISRPDIAVVLNMERIIGAIAVCRHDGAVGDDAIPDHVQRHAQERIVFHYPSAISGIIPFSTFFEGLSRIEGHDRKCIVMDV